MGISGYSNHAARRGRLFHGLGSIHGLAVAVVAMCVLAIGASSALAAEEFGVTEANFEAGTCTVETCTYKGIKENPGAGEAFTQAAGHPAYGITTFTFNSREVFLPGTLEPIGAVKHLRVDLPPGLAANPEALPKCAVKAFEEDACEEKTRVGTNELVVYASPEATGLPIGVNLEIKAPVFNLEQPEGLPLDFGIHAEALGGLVKEHIFLEGHVSWSTDYHEYFEIKGISRATPIVKSKLIFKGNSVGSGFLTLPSECSATTTSNLEVEPYEGKVVKTPTKTPVGVSGCGTVPFAPTLELNPETTQSDQTNGATVQLKVPQSTTAGETNSSDLQTARVTLPEGLTLNPSVANALGKEVCTDAQFGVGTPNQVVCPATSKIGTVAIETPDLPAGSLSGYVYVGQPLSSVASSGEEFRIFVEAQSAKYGLLIRLVGHVSASTNPDTGQLTATFSDNPQLPFKDFILHFNGGAFAPLANPLVCGAATTTTSLTPYTGGANAAPTSQFTVEGCPSPLPFALGVGTSTPTPAQAGAYSPFTLGISRADGQQYLSQVKTTLPPGLLGAIPSIPLCQEPQAAAGACPATSNIGTVTANAGSGSNPYAFAGQVYLTGPVNGDPYGMSMVVPAVAGPYNLGNVKVLAGITVDPSTARITVTGNVPTVFEGVPLRLKNLTVSVNKKDFLFNPTSCAALATETTLTSVFGATLNAKSPFQVNGCSALPFTPKFSASTNARTSRANGASLEVKISQGPNQANMHSVLVSLPKQLPSRLKTIQKACPDTSFNVNPPGACPSGSRVGGVTVKTPVLPGTLSGPAYLVSHGGAAFPDLDLILRGDGVTVILVGHINITKAGITSSSFETIPDVPISSFALNLPVGGNSALSGNGSLCTSKLAMPTTIVAQSGAKIVQKTPITVAGCGVKVSSHKVKGHTATIVAQAPSGGRLSASATNLKRVTKKAGKAGNVTLKVSLSKAGLQALARKHTLRIKVRIGFLPTTKHPTSKAYATVTFKS